MAIHHRHAGTGSTDAHGPRFYTSRGNLAEDLANLPPHFLFFLGDIGDHIIDNVQAEYPTIATSTGDSLQRRHHHSIDPKSSHQWCQRDGQPDSCTVGIRRDKPFPATLPALLLDEPDMVVVY